MKTLVMSKCVVMSLDTCSHGWQSRRDGLFISAFMLSIIYVIIAAVMMALACFKRSKHLIQHHDINLKEIDVATINDDVSYKWLACLLLLCFSDNLVYE